MNKNVIICTSVAIVTFVAGWFTSLKVNTDSVEAAQFKREIIETQDGALILAGKIMYNNNLFDIDGSDDVADYLELCCKLDSLWATTL